MPPPTSRPATAYGGATQQAANQPRMIRRHSYSAITPEMQSYDHVNWLRLCIIAVSCIVLLVALAFFFLRATSPGQRLLAANGREASMEAYHEVGRMYLNNGSISRAVWALEIAYYKDPDSLETLIDLGRAYMGLDDIERAQAAFSEAIRKWPAYPEPYRMLIGILQDQGENYQALQLIEMARENNGDSYFEMLYTQLIPTTPTVSVLGGRFDEPIEIELKTTEEGATILYTNDGSDPVEEGIPYDAEEKIQLEEGGWRIRAVAMKDGMFSKEQAQNYSINKPLPDMPRSNLAQGTYDSVRTISLRGGGNEPVTIYYTTDGTAPIYRVEEDGTIFSNGTKFEEPILLRVGKTNVRAIAVNGEGKVSNEMSLEYKCNGSTKASMTVNDGLDNLQLYNTTRSAFESNYGVPLTEHGDGEDVLGEYTKLDYSFGYAIFLDRHNDKEPVLVEISVNSTAFSGPRGTRVGSRMQDVIDEFRDEGGEARPDGDRLLYSLTTGKIGMMDNTSEETGEDTHTVSYYEKQENGQYVALIYYVKDSLVERIEWVQYDTP